MSESMLFHRRIRLELDRYSDLDSICSVTIGVNHREPIFNDSRIAEAVVRVLRERASAKGIKVYAFCVMPDHVHMVLGPSDSCSIVDFVREFKSLALRAAWPPGVKGSFWQKSFWDHFIRAEEGVMTVVEYVVANPIRAGLVDDWRSYPYVGSMVFDL